MADDTPDEVPEADRFIDESVLWGEAAAVDGRSSATSTAAAPFIGAGSSPPEWP